jgi:electron transport complex protein RnfG
MITEARSIIVTAMVLGLSLALVNHLAQPQVVEAQQAFEMKQLKAIVGDQFDIQRTDKNLYLLLRDGRTVGQLQQVSTFEGYNGEITYWLGTEIVDDQHQVVGVRVLQHDETPGLGDKLELEVSDWILSFNSKRLSDTRWDVEKYGGDFDQFSGATITPRALVKSVAKTLETLNERQEAANENR